MSDADICREIRENLMLAKASDGHNRDAYKDNARFLNGQQWDDTEVQARMKKRLMLTSDMLNAPVDQVVNGVKQNKPGPVVKPAGGGSDKEAADVAAGMLRRIDYDGQAWVAFETAFECSTGCNFGCWALDLEYENNRSFKRKLKPRAIPNPNETVFFDPTAMRKDRSDAMWAIELTMYSPSTYNTEFGDEQTETLSKRGAIKQMLSYVQEFRDPSLSGWVTNDGIQLAKYWKVTLNRDVLRLYTNGLPYLDSEKKKIPKTLPNGEPVIEDKTQNIRDVDTRELKWYVTNGIDVLKRGDWSGEWIPLFPVFGRERWVNGKRYITSMIQFAKNAQQAFNFAFTGACEVLASVAKAPFLGLLGQFKSKRAQWEKANTELQAYLEFDEVEIKGSGGGTLSYTTPPQRNVQEPPVQAFLSFCALCVNAIQRATSIFDPSLGKQKSDQSGKAIQELQAQSNEGNFHWSANLTATLEHYYRVVWDMCQREYDGPQITNILRADGTAEEVWINKEFDAGQDDEGNKITKHHKIADGNFAIVVEVGPSANTQREALANRLDGLMKVLPPQMIAMAADLFFKIHDLGPLGDQIADRLTPPQYRDPQDPQSAAAKLMQATQQIEGMQQLIQKLTQIVQTKQPELEMKKYIAELQALTAIRVAQEKNNNDTAEREASNLDTILGLAHEATEANKSRIHEMQQNSADRAHALDMEHTKAELAPEPVAAGGGE